MGPRVVKIALAVLAATSLIGCGSGDSVPAKDDIGKTPGLTIGPQTPKGGAPPKSTDKASTN